MDLKQIFKIEVSLVSAKERVAFIFYVVGIVYFLLGVATDLAYGTFYRIAWYLYSFLLKCTACNCSDDVSPFGRYETCFSLPDLFYWGLFILSLSYVLRWILTKKLNPLPWK